MAEDRKEMTDDTSPEQVQDPSVTENGSTEPADDASATELPEGEDRGGDAEAEGDAEVEGNAEDVDDAEDGDDAEAAEDEAAELSDLDEEEYAAGGEISDSELFKLRTKRRKSGVASSAPAPRERRRAATAARSAVADEQAMSQSHGGRAGAGAGNDSSEGARLGETDAARQRRELEERLDAALASRGGKRKKMSGDDIERMQDGMIARLRDSMREAAMKDAEAVEKGEPALSKVKMLPQVVNVLGKQSLADSILDGNLLESVRLWLEPLPDASLPSYEIQKELFKALETLPIKTLHLRESGLGRVVLFYQKSRRPHLAIKRTADRLIGDWTRPIMGRSDNYRDKRVRTAAYDADEAAFMDAPRRAEGRSAGEEAALRRGRAAMPTSRGETYLVAPVSSVMMPVDAKSSSAAAADSPLRRMKSRLASATKKTKKSGVSIEGRNLN